MRRDRDIAVADNSQSDTKHFTYRIFSPLGAYPAKSLSSPLGQLIVQKDFIALAFNDNRQSNDLKFMLAMLLSVNDEKGFLKLYPFPYKHFFDTHSFQVTPENLHQDIQQKLSDQYRQSGETIPEFDLYQNAKGASLPMILGGTLYSTFEDLINTEQFHRLSDILYQKKDGRFNLLCKSLLMSNQNSCHFQFSQQAVLFLLDALMLCEDYLGRSRIDSSRLQNLLTQLGDDKTDALIGKYQMAESMTPMDYHKTFDALCHTLTRFLLQGEQSL
ncbi:MAG: hypothetical protein HUJ16_09630 [Kangiella sp.]|nr:hypothetical protein [Kangiella sp.]